MKNFWSGGGCHHAPSRKPGAERPRTENPLPPLPGRTSIHSGSALFPQISALPTTHGLRKFPQGIASGTSRRQRISCREKPPDPDSSVTSRKLLQPIYKRRIYCEKKSLDGSDLGCWQKWSHTGVSPGVAEHSAWLRSSFPHFRTGSDLLLGSRMSASGVARASEPVGGEEST